jgi:phospholipid/cholesterol/gamma-HCH transport system substrate-binding protein
VRRDVGAVRLAVTERRPWLIGLVSIAVLIAGTSLAFSVNRFEGLRGVYSISADLADAAGLQSGNEVRIAGVKVGRITDVHLEDHAARVTLEIADDIRIPRETLLEVKLKTLLGQKFIDLQFPRDYLEAVSAGDASDATAGFLEGGDVIPLEQTSVPFEVYQAAREGTAVLEGIDKQSLRKMLRVLAGAVEVSKEEIGAALGALDRAGKVLAPKGAAIGRLLRDLDDVSGTLARSDTDIDALLAGGADLLDVLAERRADTSALLAAADDLGRTLGLLLQVARGSIQAGARDLNSILIAAGAELDALELAIEELGPAQELFAAPLQFGRFTEGHVCAVTTEDTCVPGGDPSDPGFPVKGTQPEAP